MNLSFVETRLWTDIMARYFPNDDAYADFQRTLLAAPEQGAVMPGCGGLRKIRWADPRRGKGKRGGLRIIYLHVAEAGVILLLAVYDKDTSSDLSAAEKKFLSEQADVFRQELQQRRVQNGKKRR